MHRKIRKILKKYYLLLNDKTIKTRFSFDAEYARWEKYNKKRKDDVAWEKKVEKPNVYFLIPGSKISGGIAVIFKHANELFKRGYGVKILSLAQKNDSNWYPDQRVEIVPYSQTRNVLDSGDIDILFATAYSTAYTVDMAKAKRKLYFVQSDESKFFPDDKPLCEKIRKTYELPLEYVATVTWLKDWLEKDFGHKVQHVPLGLDLNVFHKTEPLEPKSDKVRVLIEGAIDVPYKGMDDAYETVKDLDCELWVVSNNGKPKNDWKYDRFFENVPINKMPEIYSSCDILLKMSKVESFSYPPLEMMACGGASVIKKVTGIEEYAVDGENCLIVENVTEAKTAVQKLIEDRELRKKLIENGYQTAKEWNWKKSIEILEKVITSQRLSARD